MGANETQLGTGLPERSAGLTTVLGRYRIDQLLGGGGCGLVYAGRHELLGKRVAIKVLRPELARVPAHAQRFFREARIAATLHHENIVDITDFGDEMSESPYLVMELLRGRTLMSVVREKGMLPWPRVVSIMIQLSRALVCAHGQGVIHRDLKPHNIMLEDSSGVDRVKLCDFGLSRLSSGDDRITATGDFVGTPAYMAPEQIFGSEQDARCDLYALGVTGFELLTGSLPYDATNSVALVAEIIGKQRVGLRDRMPTNVPDALVDVIERCLATAPADRPQSAVEVEAALLAIVSSPTPAATDQVGQLIGSYRITQALGVGGSGSVWLAEHPLIGTKVAIKILRPEVAFLPGIAERFINEARAASLIPSAHIARYLDIGRLPSGQLYAILEYLEGETLFERIAQRIRLPVGEAVAIARQVASGLVQAHAAGIVHRDIKPENVFLMPFGSDLVAKVLDFGIAKMSSAGSGPQTQLGYFMGTISYCPPEQILGEAVGPPADVYALGATIFHMLVGHPPFTGDSTEISRAKTTRAAPPLRQARADVPAHVAALVDAMVSLQISERPTMAEVLDRLAGTPAAGETVAIATPAAPEPPAAPEASVVSSTMPAIGRGLRVPIALGSVVAAAVIGAAFWALWPSASLSPVPRSPEPAAATARPAASGPIAPDPAPDPASVAPPPAASSSPSPIKSAPGPAKATQRERAISSRPSRPRSTAKHGAGKSAAPAAPVPPPVVPPKADAHPPEIIIADPFGGT